MHSIIRLFIYLFIFYLCQKAGVQKQIHYNYVEKSGNKPKQIRKNYNTKRKKQCRWKSFNKRSCKFQKATSIKRERRPVSAAGHLLIYPRARSRHCHRPAMNKT